MNCVMGKARSTAVGKTAVILLTIATHEIDAAKVLF
jgi:hypothetical protein